jgi:hypothetical protein
MTPLLKRSRQSVAILQQKRYLVAIFNNLLIYINKIAHMKKFLSIVVACIGLCVMLSSCGKESLSPEAQEQVIQGSANCIDRAAFLEGKSYREYHAAYMDLPTAKKKCLWEDKLNHSLQFFSDEGQRNFIVQSASLLTENRFVDGNEPGFEEAFVSRAKAYFNFDQIARIYMVLHDYDHPPMPMGPNASGGGAATNCECYYSLYCGVLGMCNPGGCVQIGGCGIFKGTPCRGLCESPYL